VADNQTFQNSGFLEHPEKVYTFPAFFGVSPTTTEKWRLAEFPKQYRYSSAGFNIKRAQ
jgi:hypothetical protein